jgi:hypothetical protein
VIVKNSIKDVNLAEDCISRGLPPISACLGRVYLRWLFLCLYMNSVIMAMLKI